VLLLAGIVVRLLDEERFLVLNLPGYARYHRQVRYRLLPGVW
jgi:protein-S-isoprenylcysteine O-methyltransferase Ste14